MTVTTSTHSERGFNPRLVWRLFLAMACVVVIGGATLLVVALNVAPQYFHRHLVMVGGPEVADLQRHVDEAFGQAVFISLIVGIGVAFVAALAVTWFIARRLARPVAHVADAAALVAAGDYDVRVPRPNLGPEFEELADSFNSMATRLSETEDTRRQLINDLAHELRNPLASLQATLEAAQDGVLPADDTTWATLNEQVGRLEFLVRDLSRVSRAEAGQLELNFAKVSVQDIASEACLHANAKFVTAGIPLTTAAPDSDVWINADVDRMGEVLGNLLDNALRHSHTGQSVRVLVESDRDWVTIAVEDSGDGFSPADASRLFERFYRGDAARQRDEGGSGIGLTIARAIVLAHGGTLTASSPGPGEGATFEIRLPLD
jgi:signal transduction histidine kinase